MMLCNFLKKYILKDSVMRLCFTEPIPGLLCINYDIRDDMVVYIPINFNTCFTINDILDDEHWIHQFSKFSVVGISEGLLVNGFPEIHIVVKHDNIEEKE